MKWIVALAALLLAAPAHAQTPSVAPTPCSTCAEWNMPQKPFRVYGNTYYVGTHGLGAILIASDQGLILIDGALAESAPQIADNIRALGFKLEAIRLILNTHDHFDHAGGIAWLAQHSGAKVAATASSAAVLKSGKPGADDPQHDIARAIAPVSNVQIIRDGETLRVGPLAVTAHATPGHTSGGTSWTWPSCEKDRCLNIVYADSLTPVSADSYRFTDHPDLLHGFDKSFDTLNALPCDILLTPHPGFTGLWDNLKARDSGQADALMVSGACHKYADGMRAALQKRLAQETVSH